MGIDARQIRATSSKHDLLNQHSHEAPSLESQSCHATEVESEWKQPPLPPSSNSPLNPEMLPAVEPTVEPNEENRTELEQLRHFERYCRLFYEHSLAPQDETQEKEKEEATTQPSDVDKGRQLLEALDRATRRASPLDANEHPQDAANVLAECGLLQLSPADIPRYVRARDAARRLAHRTSMMRRQSTLLDLLRQPARADADLTQVTTIQAILDIIHDLRAYHRNNVATHSFFHGLHRFIDEQLRAPSAAHIVRWTFRGAVLTEACRQNSFDYASHAIQLLFSFLTWDDNDHTLDLENGFNVADFKPDSPPLTFEINRSISNANLKRILNALPHPATLDARPTGTTRTLTANANDSHAGTPVTLDTPHSISPRINVDGHLDEPWPWFGIWGSCNLL